MSLFRLKAATVALCPEPRGKPKLRAFWVVATVLSMLVPPGGAVAQRGTGRALEALRSASEHGLPSARYGLRTLEQLPPADPGAADSLMASLIRLAEDLRYGAVRPNAFTRDRQQEQLDIPGEVRRALAADTVPELMEAMAPAFPQYRRLREALRRADSLQVPGIMLTMERMRWLPRLSGTRVVLVNVPAFELAAYDSAGLQGDAALRMRVIAGAAGSHPTPLLAGGMRTVTFRPFWNVPASILSRELLPAIREDPRYLIERDMEIVGPRDSVLGDTPTPEMLGRLARGEVWIRQRPGERNALGAVKFEFQNPSSIFLHDTPNKELFANRRRDLSHGCIRVEAPAALADWVLAGRPGWSSDSTERAMAGPERRVLPVPAPTVVILFYGTAEAMQDGTLRLHSDVYGLDRRLLATMRDIR